MAKLSSFDTAVQFKNLIDAAKSQQNASVFAFTLNLFGDEKTVDEFFAVRGVVELVCAALPKEQHSVGHLARYV